MEDTTLKIVLIIIVFIVVAAISFSLIVPYVSKALSSTYKFVLP